MTLLKRALKMAWKWANMMPLMNMSKMACFY
jgi:hypothetical protein